MDRRPNLSEPGYHGVQNLARWTLGDSGPRSLCNLGQPPESGSKGRPPNGLWRVSVKTVRSDPTQVDAPTLNLTWGAGHASEELQGVLTPALILAPGFLIVQATLAVPATAPLQVVCEVTPVWGGEGCCQKVLTVHTGAGQQLPATVNRVQALNAVNITPAGSPAVVLAAGDTLDVAQPTVLTSGVVYAEHVL